MQARIVPQPVVGKPTKEHGLDSWGPMGAFVEYDGQSEALVRAKARDAMQEVRKRTTFDTFDAQQSNEEPTLLHPRKKQATTVRV